jgi:hypothetical protein
LNSKKDGIAVFTPDMLKQSSNPEIANLNSAEDFIKYLIGDELNFIQEIVEKIDKLEKSPIKDLLQEVSMTLTGQPSKVLDLIFEQKSEMKKVRYENFMLNSEVEKEIDEAQGVLNILTILLESANGGLNQLLNTKRIKIDKPELAIIDENTKSILVGEILFVQKQLNGLKRLSEQNQGNKIAENKNIAVRDSAKRFQSFLKPKEGSMGHIIQKRLAEKFKSFTSFKDLVSDSDIDFDSLEN